MSDERAGPRHHLPRSALSGVGTPEDRQARIAARRAFVNLKQTYLMAIDAVPGPRAEWLRFQIRHAAEPADLWLLRAAVFEALPRQDLPHRARHAAAGHRIGVPGQPCQQRLRAAVLSHLKRRRRPAPAPGPSA